MVLLNTIYPKRHCVLGKFVTLVSIVGKLVTMPIM